MSKQSGFIVRRDVLRGGLCLGAAALTTPGVFADMIPTPSQTEGPFYPNQLPLDTDNDLLIINDSITPAVGEITHLSGRVLDVKGNPVRNAFVEIWQVDNNAVYLHSGDTTNRDHQDKNFQGYGRFLTDSKGRYYFRTIKPVPYPGRTPHIHFAISRHGSRVLTTQLYVNGHPGNAKDGIYRSMDVVARETVVRDFNPIKQSKIGELSVTFDIVLGITAAEDGDGLMRGIGKPQSGNRQASRMRS